MLSNFTAHKSDSIISMTGPKAYFFDGVAPVLRRNGCATRPHAQGICQRRHVCGE